MHGYLVTGLNLNISFQILLFGRIIKQFSNSMENFVTTHWILIKVIRKVIGLY